MRAADVGKKAGKKLKDWILSEIRDEAAKAALLKQDAAATSTAASYNLMIFCRYNFLRFHH